MKAETTLHSRHLLREFLAQILTSSYINCSVKADFPTPPLPTMMTLCKANEFCPLGLFAAIFGLRKIHRY